MMHTHDSPQSSLQDNTHPKSVRFAGFWIRFVAYVVDSLILSILYFAILSITVALFGMDVVDVVVANIPGDNMPGDVFVVQTDVPAHQLFISLVIPWLYFTLLESSSLQATYGKKLMGLKVVDEMGKRIHFGQANLRFWSKILSALLLYVGFFMIGWTRYKQGLHDKIADTFVIFAKSQKIPS